MSSETKKRRIDPNGDTTMHDDDPPRRLRSALPSEGPRPTWAMPLAVALVVCAILYGVYRLGVSRGSQNVAGAPETAPASGASTRVLLLDPVCKKAVDPANAPAILDFNGKSIYFDSLDCLNAFRADPVKYGAGRIVVHANMQTEREGASDATASAAPPAPPSPSASGNSLDSDLAPGGPPEPPGTDAAEPSAPAPSSKDDAPSADAPLTQAPKAAPDQAEPKSRSVSDAPAVTETYPSQPPTDLPARAPSVPDMGEKKQHTGASKPAASSKTSSSKTSSSGRTTTDLPKTAPAAAPADPNGFSLPPDFNEGPPSRKPGAAAKKPAAKPGKQKPSSGDPPSVNESDDMH